MAHVRLPRSLFALAAAVMIALPATYLEAKNKGPSTLVIGLDISDATTLDPARGTGYSSPSAIHAAYDGLVTMNPGDYVHPVASLATSWAKTPDGAGPPSTSS